MAIKVTEAIKGMKESAAAKTAAKNVAKAAASAKRDQQITQLVSPPASKPTKLETISSYSAPAGTVINTATIDEILKKNIDGGDPNIITGEKLKSAEEKRKIDPSLGNLLSIKSSIAKGAAALGIQKISTGSGYGTTSSSEISYTGDLIGAAKSLGIDVNNFKTATRTSIGGAPQAAINKSALYNAINDKANQLGLYAITERDPGTTGSGDNATHITTYYQNSNGVLRPLKDASGQTATTKFKADTYVSDPGFLGGLWEGVKGIATELAPIISLALPNLGLTAMQLLAAQAAQAIATGASPTDVLRGAIGSLAAAQVPDFLDELKVVSAASPALKSAINNAAVQATFAAFTDQNVALNAIAGAIGGTAAELSKDLGDPALQKAVGEFTKNKALGMSDVQAGMAAAQDYAQTISKKNQADRTAAQNQVVEAFSQPRTPGVGTQLGEATAAAGAIYSDPEAAREAAQLGIELPSGLGKTIPVLPDEKTLPAVTVTGTREPIILTPNLTQNLGLGGRVDKKPPTTAPPSLDIANLIAPVPPVPPAPPMPPEPPEPPVQPVDTTGGTPGGTVGGITGRDKDIIDLAGIGTSGTSTGTSGLGGVDIGLGGDGTGGAGTGGTGTGGEGTGGKGDGGGGEEDILLTPKTKPTDSIILDLISGGGAQRGQRMPTTPEAESMAALTQALRIGDPGDALFGGKLGRRRNVWNVESLRLRDELGG